MDMGRRSSGKRQPAPKCRGTQSQKTTSQQSSTVPKELTTANDMPKTSESSLKNEELKEHFKIFNVKLQGLKEMDIIHASKQVVGKGGIIGVQYIPRTKQWIIYANDENCRDRLLVRGIDIGGIHVVLNLYIPPQSDKTRISIHDVPFHVTNSTVATFLSQYCEQSETVVRCTVTDPLDGSKYYNGNRFCYVTSIKKPIPNFVQIETETDDGMKISYPIRIFYTSQPAQCHHCKSEDHQTKDCPNRPPIKCYNCQQSGHSGRVCPRGKIRCRTAARVFFRCLGVEGKQSYVD